MRRFEIITEADARTLDIGSTVELVEGGHVTPLARDTLTARRITVVGAGLHDSSFARDLLPAADIRRVAIGSDHSGVALKRAVLQHLRGRGLAVTDLGTDEAFTNLPGGPSENRFSKWYKIDIPRWLSGGYKRLAPRS